MPLNTLNHSLTTLDRSLRSKSFSRYQSKSSSNVVGPVVSSGRCFPPGVVVVRDLPRLRPFARQVVNPCGEKSFLPLLNDSIVSIPLSSRLKKDRPTATNNLQEEIFPLQAQDVLSRYGEYLNELEKDEIKSYGSIFYFGWKCSEKRIRRSREDYLSLAGFYSWLKGDHLSYRYEVLEVLGQGSFGVVLQCFDHQLKENVACKIIRKKKTFEEQAIIERNLLQHLIQFDEKDQFNVIHLKHSFTFRTHFVLVLELLGINLYQLIEKNNYQGFSIDLVRRFAISILQCLQLLAKEQIIHCDLKPENILLREKGSCALKVIDFGSACYQSSQIYTYIQSRFYRSPEIILGMKYTSAIDMWSVACILVELFTGYPLFAGEDEEEQLAMIIEVIGLPNNELIEQGRRKKLFFDSKGTARYLSSKRLRKRRPGSRKLEEIVRTTNTLFLDFLRQCLQWDPCLRLSAVDALVHPWLVQTRLKRASKRVQLQSQSYNDLVDVSTPVEVNVSCCSRGMLPSLSTE